MSELEYNKFQNKGASLVIKQNGDDRRGLLENVYDELRHPFYFYDMDPLKKHFQYLYDTSKGVAKLWYACKSNPISSVMKAAAEVGIDFDIASPGELAQVLRQGVDPSRILVTGPAKSKNLLNRLLDNGVRTFVLESHNQVKWLSELAVEKNIKPDVLLRLQLRWDESESSVLGGNEITPFGLEARDWAKLDKTYLNNLNLLGVHSFQWGNILCEERMAKIWRMVFNEASKLAQNLEIELKVLDLGGGIGIPYKDQEKTMDWEVLMQELKQLKVEFAVNDIWLELGRYAVGPYGGYITRIIDKKVVGGTPIIVLDSGMNQFARPALTKQHFPCEALKDSSGALTNFQIHGPLCTALDNLGTLELAESVGIGDLLIFHQCGAYGFTESMPYFLCHSLPGEGIITDNTFKLIRVPRPAEHYLV